MIGSKVVSKRAFDEMIQALAETSDVVAPVSRGYDRFSYREVKDASTLEVDGYIPTLNPPKKYFLPPEEVLVEFATEDEASVASGARVRAEPRIDACARVLLGVRTCDLKAIRQSDEAYKDTFEDDNYFARRNRATLIGLTCLEPCDEHAFCAAMGANDVEEGFDLLLTDWGDDWIVSVGSERGDDLLETLQSRAVTEDDRARWEVLQGKREEAFAPSAEKIVPDLDALPDLVGDSEDSAVWIENGDLCLGCGRCNLVCPTCFCFDVQDDVSLGLSSGERKRRWDGCTLLEFALVAGDENFRSDRKDRLRHKLYHKTRSTFDRYGEVFCTGCARCFRTCLVDIYHPEMYNALHERLGGES